MRHVSVLWLPPKCAPLIQPLYQGIIRFFKAKYRHLLIQHVLASLENKKVREQGPLFLLMLVRSDRPACLSLF